MANQIFISHSKANKDLLDELAIPFANAGVKRFIAGFEDIEEPANETIQEKIQRSCAIFVVIGPNAKEREHTKLWIAWEVGIATQSNKDVWVLEDINSPVHMPIPSLSNYLLWDSKDGQQKRELRDLIETEFDYGPQDRVRSAVLRPTKDGKRDVPVEGENTLSETPRGTECPHGGCGATFNLRFQGVSQFNCPVCRRAVTVPGVHRIGG